MNRANTLLKTSSDIPTNVALYAEKQGKKWHDPSRQTWQKVGFSGRRSCGLHPFALSCAWANTVKWLK
jgi:hypothetical protein